MNKHPKHYDCIYIEFEFDKETNMTKHTVYKSWRDSHKEPLIKFWIPGNTTDVHMKNSTELVKARLKRENITFGHYTACYSYKKKSA